LGVKRLASHRPSSSRAAASRPRHRADFRRRPSPWTEPIAERLERHGGRETFFAIGEAIEGEGREIVECLLARGHEVANHTWTHADWCDLAAIQQRLGCSVV
jgi:peptidoglycan/xylan/chitin deacetylase (PgdA/CDA1 family)